MAEDCDKEVSYEGVKEMVGELFRKLPVVKKEIHNYYDNEFESTPFSVQENREPVLHQESESGHIQPLCSALPSNENLQNTLLNCNKIILGSKPNINPGDEDSFERTSKSYQEEKDDSIDENYFEELVASYEPSVVLQDIQSYLIKSKRFCDSCCTLFPALSGYESHVKIFHNEKHKSGMSHQRSLTERRQHECSICNKEFVAPHELRKHLITIHNLNNEKVMHNTINDKTANVMNDTTDDGKITQNTKKVIGNTVMPYASVFRNITKEPNTKVTENNIKQTNDRKTYHESSDLSNTCFHCKKSFNTQKCLIEHLYETLQMQRKNTEIVPVLKSVLFKCNKCDIHFTSSRLAADHSEHMEMLINWKCSICNRIFKKEDELSHERQHSVSNNYLTYNLGDLDVANILFRCSKCAAHFTESNFLYHFRDCSLVDTKTVTCKICNIVLDYNLKSTHELDKHTESKPFTIIQCDVISDNPVKSTFNRSQTRDNDELLKSFREVKIVLQKIDAKKSDRLTESDNNSGARLSRTGLKKSKDRNQKDKLLLGVRKTKLNEDARRIRNLTYTYCRTCNCFLTKLRKDFHIQGRCIGLARIACTCEQCGLILNSISIKTHRRLHQEDKDLKLADFRFFNLFNGRSINPPIPQYPKCTQCAVHFLTKTIRKNHICSKVVYHICHLCEMKLSEAAFKLHMTFHQYANNRMKRRTKINSNIGKSITDENITPNNRVDVAGTTLTENRNGECTMNDKTELDALRVENKKTLVRTAHSCALKRRNLTYFYCETCKCFVTKFKKSAHVQGRCKNMGKVACACTYCGLIFNSASIVTHRRLHVEKRDLQLKNFRFFNLYTGRSMNPPIPEYSKCTHCAVHFLAMTDKKEHICNEQVYHTCNLCEMKLSSAAFKLHMAFHEYASDRNKIKMYKHLQPPITPDVVKLVADGNSADTTNNKNELPNHLPDGVGTKVTKNTIHEYASDRNKITMYKNLQPPITPDVVKLVADVNSADTTNNKNELPNHLSDGVGTKVTKNTKRTYSLDNAVTRRNLTYFYCETCKCFVTKFKKSAHVQGRCKNMGKVACACTYCGLIFNSASIVTHRRLHVEKRDLQLKNFRFFNLYTGRSMNPPIPEYSKCTHCAVHFLAMTDKKEHICNEQVYHTCNLCELKLSSAAFKLHMAFHEYASDRNKIKMYKHLQPPITPDVVKLVADGNSADTTNNKNELPNHLPDGVGTKVTKNTIHEYASDRNKITMYKNLQPPITPDVVKLVADVNSADTTNNKNELPNHLPDGVGTNVKKNTKRTYSLDNAVTRRNLTYFYCETCKCFVTKFKNAAHVQGRCKKLGKMASACTYCGLILNSASIVTHCRLHEEKKSLKLKHFRFFNLYTGRSMHPPIPEYPKCTHCAVHFLTLTDRNNHICGEEAYEMCNLCEIKLSSVAFTLHMTFHQYAADHNKNLQAATTLDVVQHVTDENITDVTTNYEELPTKTSDLVKNVTNEFISDITMNDNELPNETLGVVKGTADENVTTKSENEIPNNLLNVAAMNPAVLRERRRISRKYDIKRVCALKATNIKTPVKIAELRRRNLTYFYCKTCKCFVTKFKKAVHVQGRCKNLGKMALTCEYCGLRLNSASIVTHMRLHDEKKDLKLNNFRFFNLYTGRSTNPPIPEYPKCTHCAVHFVTEKDKTNHICNSESYQTCHVCLIKLSDPAFKLHMTFHEYATDRINRTTSKNSHPKTTLNIAIPVTDENIIDRINRTTSKNSHPKTTLNIAIPVTDENIINSKENKNETMRHPFDVPEMKLNRCISQEYKINDKTQLDTSLVVNENNPVNTEDNMTYSYCETCQCFTTSLTKADHAQGRCEKLDTITCICEYCGLVLNEASIVTHRRLHDEKKDLKLKNFSFFNLYTGQSMNPPIPEYPKCAHCAVHFLTIKAKDNHICTQQASQACRLCQTKLSQAAFKLHMMFHQYETDRCKIETSKDSHSATTLDIEKRVIDENESNNTVKYIDCTQNLVDVPETKLDAKTSEECNIPNKTEQDALQTVNKKRLVDSPHDWPLGRRNVAYSFCETCKCFVTSFRKDVHVQGRCKYMSKKACTCEHCGLILNSASIVTHRRLHDEKKDLKLNNFTFLNLYTGTSMNPPIPQYPKCANCEIHFPTKNARNEHVCSKEVYRTCHICEIKLNEIAFKLHMTFHHYATNRINNTQSAKTLDIQKRVTNKDISNSTENETELIYNPLEVTETSVRNSSDILDIVYTCANCSISVDTYDKAIEHCQGHYENEDQEIQTKVCSYCNLRIDAACYMEHKKLHEKGKQFKLLKFDSYYLPVDNNMWVKHIFETLPSEKVLDILKSSIYRFECRIKMDIIQQGDPDFTLYKCDQCNFFIEPSSLFKHSDNSCFKLRRHPCTECGIPFNSSASRIDHEKIHSRPGITKDSYRIVAFNRERDMQRNRAYSLRKNYVLFQCRNCGVIIDKLQEDIHKCDLSNVKKCPLCALVLHARDFEKHENKHKEFISFNYNNMKIIIVGEDEPFKDCKENNVLSNFKGSIYDYKIYVCNKCAVCVKNEMCISNHICCFGKQRMKCLKCDLYFSVGRLKTHTKFHEQDPDFVRSNMNIILFDPCTVDQNKNTTTEITRFSKDCELSDTDSDSEILAANDTSIPNDIDTRSIDMSPEILEEELVKIYKCPCELHFLNEDSIIRHFGVCRPDARISKQKCPKCDLLFTPNILLTHMLAHHCKKIYKYDVIEMDPNQ